MPVNVDRLFDSPASEYTEPADELAERIVGSVMRAPLVRTPFVHLALEDVFPANVYRQLLAAMPTTGYRGVSGRSRSARREDGTPTRMKIDLFPECVRGFSPEHRLVWQHVGHALRSSLLRRAFVERLTPGLEQRFGRTLKQQRFYPIPILTRDRPGYSIAPHTDTHWKGITVQLYLPPDDSIAHVGTVFHQWREDGTLERATRMPFAPNSGYAFAVGDDTWHSADVVGPEVRTRDSIVLTYFVDTGPLLFVRNRARRTGNALRHLAVRSA